jgi:hypothetical protein
MPCMVFHCPTQLDTIQMSDNSDNNPQKSAETSKAAQATTKTSYNRLIEDEAARHYAQVRKSLRYGICPEHERPPNLGLIPSTSSTTQENPQPDTKSMRRPRKFGDTSSHVEVPRGSDPANRLSEIKLTTPSGGTITANEYNFDPRVLGRTLTPEEYAAIGIMSREEYRIQRKGKLEPHPKFGSHCNGTEALFLDKEKGDDLLKKKNGEVIAVLKKRTEEADATIMKRSGTAG